MNKTLMVQGTTSDAGKSTLVAALCRVWARKQHRIAPFKPQNMALNSAVTPCGGEIGRAQAVQAQAANVECDVHFNPVLLKPQSDTSAQVIIQGKALPAMEAADYHAYKKTASKAVMESHQRLTERYDYVFVEGAGSPAEINLRKGDIANMGFAEAVDCPVIIIADIDKGGVFAHLVGTLDLLSKSEQNRVVGFVINRFRGDIGLLQSGLDWLEQRTQKPVLGVLPFIHGLTIASEDAVEIEQDKQDVKLKIIVPVYPRMSNHTDFDALRIHPEIDLEFVFASEVEKVRLPPADLIILPGSKSVLADLAFLKAQGWDTDIARHLRYGGKVFGICGGYQMLGQHIADPLGIESPQTKVNTNTHASAHASTDNKAHLIKSDGLGYLPHSTTLAEQKTLLNVNGHILLGGQSVAFSGYEIHAGQSTIDATHSPLTHSLLTFTDNKPKSGDQNSSDLGRVNQDDNVAGCYIHGLFDKADTLHQLTAWCGITTSKTTSLYSLQEDAINTLADMCEQHLDIKQIESVLNDWTKHD